MAEKYSAPALEKGLDILELLANEPDGVSKSEIARLLDRTVSEIFRMLIVLERRGYIVTQDGSEKYTLALKLFELSHRYPPVRRLSSVSSHIMQRLSFELRQSCQLTVYYSGKAHVVVQQDAPADVIYSVRLGVEVKLAGSCSGNVLLAFADDELRSSMISAIPPEHPRPDPVELRNMIKRVRDQGYEQMVSPRTAGSMDTGFPVFDHNGRIVAVLLVSFLARIDEQRIELSAIVEALRRSSSEISAGLGYCPA